MFEYEYTIEHETVLEDDDSDPNENVNIRRNIRRRVNFMQVGIHFFISQFGDTLSTTKENDRNSVTTWDESAMGSTNWFSYQRFCVENGENRNSVDNIK